ncbi:hypothetical protein [Streptomyces sp. TRM70350]|uniref:hypothetical protein n=1 Tax=Streptomyces sp. TRM70350 TaxID=2856165 RepID=UPI001C44F0DF|nr:hypothetical protein [Streptomyces sp. TRM70350]MBV7695844.1 hypothetical protein [Streptomyces sp. TRM70350]
MVPLSARGEVQARPTEEALRESEGLRLGGELVFAGGEVKEPFVDLRDVADVVVAVLTAGDGTSGRASTCRGRGC